MQANAPTTNTASWHHELKSYLSDNHPYELVRCEHAPDGAVLATLKFTDQSSPLVQKLRTHAAQHVAGEGNAGREV